MQWFSIINSILDIFLFIAVAFFIHKSIDLQLKLKKLMAILNDKNTLIFRANNDIDFVEIKAQKHLLIGKVDFKKPVTAEIAKNYIQEVTKITDKNVQFQLLNEFKNNCIIFEHYEAVQILENYLNS